LTVNQESGSPWHLVLTWGAFRPGVATHTEDWIGSPAFRWKHHHKSKNSPTSSAMGVTPVTAMKRINRRRLRPAGTLTRCPASPEILACDGTPVCCLNAAVV